MTPCEKLGYKVGDRFEVVDVGGSSGMTVGKTVILHRDDGTDVPFFRVSGEEYDCQCAPLYCVRPLKPQTEAEKRGAKFGTMGVVKATGERVVFQKEVSGIWYFLTEGSRMTLSYNTHEIRLDHEPEYKEIPFSEATDEQRMDVGNLVHVDGDTVTQIFKFDNGAFVYTLKGYNWTGTHTGRLTVRVPA